MATAKERQSFFERFLPLARQVENMFGIPVSVTLGQAALETGYGTSTAAREDNNFFGIKAKGDAGERTHLTKEWDGKKLQDQSATFGAYSSPESSFLAYGELLSTSERYAAAYKADSSYNFLKAVKDGGYATDPEYVSKVSNIMKTNNLTQYDSVMSQPSILLEADNKYLRQDDSYKDAVKRAKEQGYKVNAEGKYEIPLDSPIIEGNSFLTDLYLIAGTGDGSDYDTEDLTDRVLEEHDSTSLNMTGRIVKVGVLILLVGFIVLMIILSIPKPQQALAGAIAGSAAK